MESVTDINILSDTTHHSNSFASLNNSIKTNVNHSGTNDRFNRYHQQFPVTNATAAHYPHKTKVISSQYSNHHHHHHQQQQHYNQENDPRRLSSSDIRQYYCPLSEESNNEKIHQSNSNNTNKKSNINNIDIDDLQSSSSSIRYSSGKHHQIANGKAKLNDQYLWIITPVAASISLAVVVAALAGPQWLYTEEKLPNSYYFNRTSASVNYISTRDNRAYITKYTKSSLWILCSTFQGIETYHCVKIDYFPKEEYRGGRDSTLVIPYTVTRSSPFFIVSGVFLLISFLVFLMAICTHQTSLYYFTSGILFIVTGLLMFIGLIVYISVFKSEIGSKLHSKSSQPLFKYAYGQSFFLYVFGFISTEFVGVLNIFLFINLQQVGHHKTIPCFKFWNLHEKFRFFTNKKQEKNNLENDFVDENDFVCKKHLFSTKQFYDQHQLYFEQPRKCSLHYSQNLARSLNELHQIGHTTSIHSPFHNYPSIEFPLTRSVSTSTDIFSKPKINNTNQTNEQNMIKVNKKNQTSQDSDTKDETVKNRILLNKSKRSKEFLFNEFCKKAGLRPKPKNIYYIDPEDSNEQNDENIFIINSNDNTLIKNSRKRNSMSSLCPRDKIYPKILLDLEQNSVTNDNNQYQQKYYPNKHYQEFWNNNSEMQPNGKFIYQSRTLPRCFLKRNYFDSTLSNNSHFVDRDISWKMNDRRSNNGIMFNSAENILHKSYDDVNVIKTSNMIENNNFPSATIQQMNKSSNNNLTIQWPTAIPASPTNFSIKSAFQYNGSSDYSDDYNSKTMSSGARFQRGYAFEQSDMFDLDEIERERRKSHANLLGNVGISTSTEADRSASSYDFLNGTAV